MLSHDDLLILLYCHSETLYEQAEHLEQHHYHISNAGAMQEEVHDHQAEPIG